MDCILLPQDVSGGECPGGLGVDCSRSPSQQNEGYTDADGAAEDALDDGKEESFILFFKCRF